MVSNFNFKYNFEIQELEVAQEYILSIEVENATTINDASDNKQHQHHKEGEDTKPEKPTRPNEVQARSPNLILVQSSI